MNLVRSRIEEPIAHLVMADAARGNVLSRAMIEALLEGLERSCADPTVRAIVLAAEGRIFCAGHDLAELSSLSQAAAATLFHRCSALMTSIVRARAPVIAAVQGAAVAAGCQLVASCDLALAADTARFAVSGIDLGLFCSTPAVALSRSIGRKAALEMLLTGRFVDAAEAARLGLVNRAVADEALGSEVDTLARTIAAKPAEATAVGKDLFGRQLELDLDAAYALAGERMAENLVLPCAQWGMRRFLDRRGAA